MNARDQIRQRWWRGNLAVFGLIIAASVAAVLIGRLWPFGVLIVVLLVSRSWFATPCPFCGTHLMVPPGTKGPSHFNYCYACGHRLDDEVEVAKPIAGEAK